MFRSTLGSVATVGVGALAALVLGGPQASAGPVTSSCGAASCVMADLADPGGYIAVNGLQFTNFVGTNSASILVTGFDETLYPRYNGGGVRFTAPDTILWTLINSGQEVFFNDLFSFSVEDTTVNRNINELLMVINYNINGNALFFYAANLASELGILIEITQALPPSCPECVSPDAAFKTIFPPQNALNLQVELTGFGDDFPGSVGVFEITSVDVAFRVPEPSTIALFGVALTGLAAFRRWGPIVQGSRTP
ncbi:PEP-CTERM sorting domain-containing protein [Elioraea rosea]|uniref:PEP-CTERM sorting domain-containing protein n=1 Tax=Elioraea rosea TaxID=2492390 RepID=UPI001181D4A4|nr:PEP-CTERM sorting domain-containing protein [Elioraea rosea]